MKNIFLTILFYVTFHVACYAKPILISEFTVKSPLKLNEVLELMVVKVKAEHGINLKVGDIGVDVGIKTIPAFKLRRVYLTDLLTMLSRLSHRYLEYRGNMIQQVRAPSAWLETTEQLKEGVAHVNPNHHIKVVYSTISIKKLKGALKNFNFELTDGEYTKNDLGRALTRIYEIRDLVTGPLVEDKDLRKIQLEKAKAIYVHLGNILGKISKKPIVGSKQIFELDYHRDTHTFILRAPAIYQVTTAKFFKQLRASLFRSEVLDNTLEKPIENIASTQEKNDKLKAAPLEQLETESLQSGLSHLETAALINAMRELTATVKALEKKVDEQQKALEILHEKIVASE